MLHCRVIFLVLDCYRPNELQDNWSTKRCLSFTRHNAGTIVVTRERTIPFYTIMPVSESLLVTSVHDSGRPDHAYVRLPCARHAINAYVHIACLAPG